MLKSSLCHDSNAYVDIKEIITISNTGTAAALNSKTRKAICKNCAPLTDCISEINNTQVDSTKDIDLVIPMFKEDKRNRR